MKEKTRQQHIALNLRNELEMEINDIYANCGVLSFIRAHKTRSIFNMIWFSWYLNLAYLQFAQQFANESK